MSLLEKSKENLKIAQHCVEKDCYNSSVSRMYYALYQKLMYILVENGFDEEKWIEEHNKETGENSVKISRPFEHKKIRKEATIFFLTQKMGRNIFYDFLDWDGIYRSRIVADYEKKNDYSSRCKRKVRSN